MTIGNVIKKYRKNKSMTQEEMAARLGVTAPAVNKWEKGNALPDVALLAPIARLLGITTDELLSFKDELTDEEINRYLSELQKNLECKDFHEVFLSVKKKIEKYPNCETLIWQSADSLFHAFIRQENYEKAVQYLDYFSLENPERKRKKALVDSKTGKRTEAYRACEELIYTGYQHIQMTLNDLRILYMEDEEHEMAKKLVEVSSAVASAFEMGRYNEVCFGLDVAVWERDAAWTAQLMREILDSVDKIGDFAKSKLYQHMIMKPVDPDFSIRLRQELLKSLGDEIFHYMQGNEDWEKLCQEAAKADLLTFQRNTPRLTSRRK